MERDGLALCAHDFTICDEEGTSVQPRLTSPAVRPTVAMHTIIAGPDTDRSRRHGELPRVEPVGGEPQEPGIVTLAIVRTDAGQARVGAQHTNVVFGDRDFDRVRDLSRTIPKRNAR